MNAVGFSEIPTVAAAVAVVGPLISDRLGFGFGYPTGESIALEYFAGKMGIGGTVLSLWVGARRFASELLETRG